MGEVGLKRRDFLLCRCVKIISSLFSDSLKILKPDGVAVVENKLLNEKIGFSLPKYASIALTAPLIGTTIAEVNATPKSKLTSSQNSKCILTIPQDILFSSEGGLKQHKPIPVKQEIKQERGEDINHSQSDKSVGSLEESVSRFSILYKKDVTTEPKVPFGENVIVKSKVTMKRKECEMYPTSLISKELANKVALLNELEIDECFLKIEKKVGNLIDVETTSFDGIDFVDCSDTMSSDQNSDKDKVQHNKRIKKGRIKNVSDFLSTSSSEEESALSYEISAKDIERIKRKSRSLQNNPVDIFKKTKRLSKLDSTGKVVLKENKKGTVISKVHDNELFRSTKQKRDTPMVGTILLDVRFRQRLKEWQEKRRRNDKVKKAKLRTIPVDTSSVENILHNSTEETSCRMNVAINASGRGKQTLQDKQTHKDDDTSNEGKNPKLCQSSNTLECFKLGSKDKQSTLHVRVEMQKRKTKSFNTKVMTSDYTENITNERDSSLPNSLPSEQMTRKIVSSYKSGKKCSGSYAKDYKKATASDGALLKKKSSGSYYLEKKSF